MSILMANFFGLGTEWRIPLAVITVLAIGVMNLFENKVGAIFAIITTAGENDSNRSNYYLRSLFW